MNNKGGERGLIFSWAVSRMGWSRGEITLE